MNSRAERLAAADTARTNPHRFPQIHRQTAQRPLRLALSALRRSPARKGGRRSGPAALAAVAAPRSDPDRTVLAAEAGLPARQSLSQGPGEAAGPLEILVRDLLPVRWPHLLRCSDYADHLVRGLASEGAPKRRPSVGPGGVPVAWSGDHATTRLPRLAEDRNEARAERRGDLRSSRWRGQETTPQRGVFLW